LTEANLLNISLEIIERETANGKTYKVVLEPMPGLTINGLRKLESIEFKVEVVLEIIPTEKALILSSKDIINETYKTLPTLEKLFGGVDASNFGNFKVIIDNTTLGSATTHTITLEANEWFTFNEGKTISKTFTLETILEIAPIEENIILSLEDVEDGKYNNLATLQKLFSGINVNNSAFFTVIINNNRFESESEHLITLTRNDGYIFENGHETISKEFKLDTYLNITPKNGTLILNANDIKEDKFKLEETINKLFNGISTNFNNFDVTIDNKTPGSASLHTITLTAKYGFAFGNGEKTISKTFNLETILAITPKTGTVILNAKDIEGQSFKKQETLMKLFNGISVDVLPNITITISDGAQTSGSEHTITLTANDNFSFNDGVKTISKTFTLETILNINPKTLESLILSASDVKDKLNTFEILDRLFDGLKAEDIVDKVTATLNGTIGSGSAHTITLKANDGFIFNNGKEIVSNEFSLLTIIQITRIDDDPRTITHLDLENGGYKKLTILEKLFNGIDEENSKFLDITFKNVAKQNSGELQPYTSYIITLKANDGYTFDASGN
ncbi:MAG: hypothetical protein ACRC63_00475, partial [Metamycoplasmataceae bacterium]